MTRKNNILSNILMVILSAFIFSGCGSSGNSSYVPVNSEDPIPQVTEEPSSKIEYSLIPENIYLSTGETLTFFIENGQEFNLSETDSTVVEFNTINSYSNSTCDINSFTSNAKFGHYYAIYSKYLKKFVTSEQYDSGTGLKLSSSFDPNTCIWKAMESENAICFENMSGYLQYDPYKLLSCGEEKCSFSFVPSNLADYPNSFGFITSVSGINYRLDCFSADQIASYPDDGSVYPHTAFYLCEINDESIEYTKVQITGNFCGDTTVMSGEQTYQIHVYNPDDMQITFHDANQTVTVAGYELEDNEVHDCGFYTYQCAPENNEILFTSVSEGKEKVQIGHFSYNVIFGGTECLFNEQEYSSLFEAVNTAAETVENPRLSNKKISLMSDDILYNGVLPNGVVIDFNGHYGANENALMMTYSVPNSGEEKSTQALIYPVIKSGAQYLYMPSFADFSCMQLNLPAGTVISSEGKTATIRTSSFNEVFDLTEIFGDMSEAGAEFPITVTWESGNLKVIQNVILIKSENVNSAFFELKEDSITDMPEWLNTSKSNKPDKAKAVILSSNGEIIYDGKIKTFHVRGNTNVGQPETKVGYSFKLKYRIALTGDVESKAWVLVANSANGSGRDTSSYGTAFGNTLYQRLNSDADGDYAVQYTPVDIYINGEYRGMYILTDKVNDTRFDMNISEYSSADNESRTTIADSNDAVIASGVQQYSYDANAVLENSGGFIIEISGVSYSTYGFISRRNVPVEIKSPETPTKEQVQSIAMYYQQFEDALYSEDTSESKLSDYIDLESLAKVYLVKSFLKDMDFFWGSTYFYIDADETGFTTKLKGCTAWDFDGSHVIYPGSTDELFDASLTDGMSACGYKWQLLEHKEFVETLVRLNNEKVFEGNSMSFTDIISDMIADGNFIDIYYEQVNHAMSMNKSLWPYSQWEDSITATMKQHINDRLSVWETLLPESGEISGIPE